MGYVVQIRSERNPKKFNKMTKKEKQIRKEWFQFRRGQSRQEKIYLSKEEISKIFSKMFN